MDKQDTPRHATYQEQYTLAVWSCWVRYVVQRMKAVLSWLSASKLHIISRTSLQSTFAIFQRRTTLLVVSSKILPASHCSSKARGHPYVAAIMLLNSIMVGPQYCRYWGATLKPKKCHIGFPTFFFFAKLCCFQTSTAIFGLEIVKRAWRGLAAKRSETQFWCLIWVFKGI